MCVTGCDLYDRKAPLGYGRYKGPHAFIATVMYCIALHNEHTATFYHLLNSTSSTAGVAFEQGRTLPTPEKVPFRLTRDIIDGMGVCGIEGVFRRCCEEILNTMKASREEVKTIVEVST